MSVTQPIPTKSRQSTTIKLRKQKGNSVSINDSWQENQSSLPGTTGMPCSNCLNSILTLITPSVSTEVYHCSITGIIDHSRHLWQILSLHQKMSIHCCLWATTLYPQWEQSFSSRKRPVIFQYVHIKALVIEKNLPRLKNSCRRHCKIKTTHF